MTPDELASLGEKVDLKIDGIESQVRNLTEVIDLKLTAVNARIESLDNKLYTAPRFRAKRCCWQPHLSNTGWRR